MIRRLSEALVALLMAASATAAERIAYGPAPSQFVELSRPAGSGPFPVVALIHGGCWSANYGLDLMAPAAADLVKRGYAVWNVEYRRLGEPGGGYPGTYQDIGRALDLVGERAAVDHLDAARVVAVGHSAGGQLALWAGKRGAIPSGHPLHAGKPLRLKAVVSLGGLPNLKDMKAEIEDSCGPVVARLSGPDASPAQMAPTGVPQILIHGARDGIAPKLHGEDYVRRDPAAKLLIVPGAGHFDLIAPRSLAWIAVVSAIAQ